MTEFFEIIHRCLINWIPRVYWLISILKIYVSLIPIRRILNEQFDLFFQTDFSGHRTIKFVADDNEKITCIMDITSIHSSLFSLLSMLLLLLLVLLSSSSSSRVWWIVIEMYAILATTNNITINAPNEKNDAYKNDLSYLKTGLRHYFTFSFRRIVLEFSFCFDWCCYLFEMGSTLTVSVTIV